MLHQQNAIERHSWLQNATVVLMYVSAAFHYPRSDRQSSMLSSAQMLLCYPDRRLACCAEKIDDESR